DRRKSFEIKREELYKVSALVGGELSTAGLQYEIEGIKQHVDEITEARKYGILTGVEADKELKKLSARQAELTAMILASPLGTGASLSVKRVWEAPKAASNLATEQVTGIVSGVTNLVRSLPVAGGLFALMLYGYTE